MTAEEALKQSKGVLNGYIKCTYVQLWQAAKGRFIYSMQRRYAGIANPIVTMTIDQYARKDGKYVPVTLTDYALNSILNKMGLSKKFVKRGAITQGYQTFTKLGGKAANKAQEVWVLESAINWQPKEKKETFVPTDVIDQKDVDVQIKIPDDVKEGEITPAEPVTPTPTPKKKTTTKKKDNKKLLALLLAASSFLFN